MTYILTINGGSSSVKFALFEMGKTLARKSSGTIERLSALETAEYGKRGADGVMESLKASGGDEILAIGHRIVHGGAKYLDHVRLTPIVIDELRRVAPIDPAHLPGEIALIESVGKCFPDAKQFACFDTAFHRDLPQVAKLLPIPRRYFDAGVRRFGFHGLSYAYLLEELARQASPEAASGRVIFAHLGAGASMAAVKNGRAVDTTMAFTPTAGLVMGTRSGELDPGVLVYLMRQEKMTANQIDELVNKRSGMLGVSGTSADMRDLLAKRATDRAAAEAVELFCYQARKWIGALAAALGGLDTLVFSGGIGERAPDIRAQICEGLGHLGIAIDLGRNSKGADVISTDQSPATVRVIATNEELMIARIVASKINE